MEDLSTTGVDVSSHGGGGRSSNNNNSMKLVDDSLHAAVEEATIKEVPPAGGTAAASSSAAASNHNNEALTGDRAIEILHGWIKASSAGGKKPSLFPPDAAEALPVLKAIVKDHDTQKEKIGKLKSLLGRSAKAQREAKVDLDATQKKLDNALREIERLHKKIDKLANRPTHMELLADFETNFDRALLSVGGGGDGGGSTSQQVGGEETAPGRGGSSGGGSVGGSSYEQQNHQQYYQESAVVDQMLMQELNDARARVEKLESLNGALLHRSSQLEGEVKDRRKENDELSNKVSRLELEKRMAVMEAEHATRSMQEKAASLAEMQMEIDMITKANMTANVRASKGEEIIKTVKSDKRRVQELEAQVQALQEWALASSEAKTLAQERVKLLETQLRALQHGNSTGSSSQRNLGSSSSDDGQAGQDEYILLTYNGSLVVGAGDVACHVVALDENILQEAKSAERVILRWHFDLNKEDLTIDFSLLKGHCKERAKQKQAETFIDKRVVRGGAEGEQEYAFAVENACTMLFSNTKSWIRPRTVRYNLSLLVLSH